MTFLPDVNVWAALVIAGHVHQETALHWIRGLQDDDRIVFCRVTQHGFLRLITNRKVMGEDVLSPPDAWAKYDSLCSIVGVSFLGEPVDLETSWRTSTNSKYGGPNYWTDAYLTAFANVREITVVTFDRGMANQKSARVRLLV